MAIRGGQAGRHCGGACAFALVYKMGACKGCKERREALAAMAARGKTALRNTVSKMKGKRK